jgi:hypothetical protein
MDGDRTLAKVHKELGKKNIRLFLVKAGRDNRALMEKTGTLSEIGSQNIFRKVAEAVSAAQKDSSIMIGGTAAPEPLSEVLNEPDRG